MVTSTAKAKTRTYYGEYTLKHWINLILSKNIILPEYQRSFAWDKSKIEQFIISLNNGDYIPPVTIAAGQENGDEANLILDGQQRLTAVLLIALGLIPKSKDFPRNLPSLLDEETSDNSEQDDRPEEEIGATIEWSFRVMLEELGDQWQADKSALKTKLGGDPRYERLAVPSGVIVSDLLKTKNLGFLYIVPSDSSVDSQQLFAKLFRSINYDGVRLSREESRKALYYQDLNMTDYFEGRLDSDTDILCGLRITSSIGGPTRKIDWLRYLSILSQKSLGLTPLKRYRTESSREDFYGDYVAYILGLNEQANVGKFESFKEKDFYKNEIWKSRYKGLHDVISQLRERIGILSSWIDADYWLFGLIYVVLFEGKTELVNVDNLINEILRAINLAKKDERHRSRPNQLTYLRLRIDESIEIYRKYVS